MNGSESQEESLQRVWSAVTAAVSDGSGDTHTLALVAQLCTQLLPVDGVSLSLVGGPRARETVYASGEVSDVLQRVQASLGEGPTFEAHETRRPVLVPDLAADPGPRWPVFASEIAAHRIGAVFAFPLQRGAIGIGGLEMYRFEPGWLSAEEVTTALRIVDLAGIALSALRVDSLHGEWVIALPMDRAQVHQATGMLIAGLGVPAEQALARLRAHAFAVGCLVDDIADDLVRGVLAPSDIDP